MTKEICWTLARRGHEELVRAKQRVGWRTSQWRSQWLTGCDAQGRMEGVWWRRARRKPLMAARRRGDGAEGEDRGSKSCGW